MKTKTKQSSKTDAAQIRSFADVLPESVQQEMERLLAALLQSHDRVNNPTDSLPFPFQTIEQFGCAEEVARPLLDRLVEHEFIKMVCYPKMHILEHDPLNRWQQADIKDPYSADARNNEPEIRINKDAVELLHKRLQKKLGVQKTPEIYCRGAVLYINGRHVKCSPNKPTDKLLLVACKQLNKPVLESAVRELLEIDPNILMARDLIHAAIHKLRIKTRLTGEHLSSKDGTVTVFGKQLQKVPKQ